MMTPTATRSLYDQVDRRKIADEQVEVEIERLLRDLSRDEYTSFSVRVCAVRPERFQDATFAIKSITERETSVKEEGLTF